MLGSRLATRPHSRPSTPPKHENPSFRELARGREDVECSISKSREAKTRADLLLAAGMSGGASGGGHSQRAFL